MSDEAGEAPVPAAAPVVAAPVDDAPPPPRPSREVVGLGRRWPRALPFERMFWLIAGVAATIVLGLSVWLKPDARGIGTHEQLGLPPCGFVQMFDGVPCPSCGFTTSFALAAHARPIDSFRNQPFGFALFLLTVAGTPLTFWAAARGVSLFEATERWPWGRIFCGFLGLWLLAWGYKWLVLMR